MQLSAIGLPTLLGLSGTICVVMNGLKKHHIPIVPKNIQQATWSVPFRGTTLVLWDRLPLPDGWKCDNRIFLSGIGALKAI